MGDRETVKSVTSLTEELEFISQYQIKTHNSLLLQPRGSDALFWPSLAIALMFTYTQIHTYTQLKTKSTVKK